MAAGNNLDNLSITSNNFLIETSIKGETRLNFPPSMDSNNFKSKIKWLGDVEELKSFIDKQPKLTGSWSFVSNNGGSHLFKAASVSLSFYPGTRTLNVQRAC